MLATAKYIGTDVMSSDLIGAVILILSILGFTIVLITMGIIIFKGGRGFTEGLQAVANLATIIVAGAAVGSAGNNRDDREDRKKKEEELKAKEAELKQKEAELKKQAEEIKKAKAEEANKQENANKS